MRKIDNQTVMRLESQYPGIGEQIDRFETTVTPACRHCQSADTAEVQVGIIGRIIAIAGATSRIHLIPDGPKPAAYWCYPCRTYYD